MIVGRDDGFQQEIFDRIRNAGALSNIQIVNNVYSDRFEYYSLADVFLGFPTIYEETMLASIEALSCGNPAIVSREADMPFVQEEGAGFVIDFSVYSAVEKIKLIMAHPSRYRENALRVASNIIRKMLLAVVF